MNDKEFWDLIAWVNRNAPDPDERRRSLEEALATLTAEVIEDFYIHCARRVEAGWTVDLARVAWLARGQFSRDFDEDDFAFFLNWLVERGKLTYEAALADPESLSDTDHETPWDSGGDWESIYRSWSVVTKRSTSEFSKSIPTDAMSLPSGWRGSAEEIRTRFPKLFARFVA